MKLRALAFFILFVSVRGQDYLYESIEASQDDYVLDNENSKETILTNADYFEAPDDTYVEVDAVKGADVKKEDVHTLEKADYYLTGMLDAIDKNGLLDDVPKDNANVKVPLQDSKSSGVTDDVHTLEKAEFYLSGMLDSINKNLDDQVKVEEDDYDLVEEAILMEQNIVKDPIIDDYEIDYNQLSELKLKNDYDLSDEVVAVDTSLDYVEYPNNVVEVEKEQLLIQVREIGQGNGSQKDPKDFVYFENISTEMKAMEITLSLAIFMGSTVLLVGGVLATLHVWRAVRPDPLEARNQGMKTVKLSGIVKSYAKLPADIRTLKNPSIAYQELYEPV